METAVRAKAKLRHRAWLGGSVALVMAFFAVMITPDTAQALDCNGLSGRRLAMCRTARNDGERYAVRSVCRSGGTRCGAMWMSTPGSSYTNDVIAPISWNASTISLDLRGSVNGNGKESLAIWAVNISVTQNGRRLVSGGSIYRGRHPSNSYTWTDAGESVRVNSVDVSSIPPGGRGVIRLHIHRCFRSSQASGSCADQDVDVVVRRESPPNRWTVEGRSYVSINGGGLTQNATASPGQRIGFYHKMRNNSSYAIPAYTLKRIDVNEEIDGVPSQHIWQQPYAREAKPWTMFYEPNNVKPYNIMTPNAVVTQNDVGRQVCQRIMWYPNNWNDGGWGASPFACVRVPYNYNLTPEIDAPDYITEGTAEVSGVTARINHSGLTRSQPVNYAVARFVVRGGSEYVVPSGEGVSIPYDPRRPGNLVEDWDCYIATNVIKRSRAGLDVTDCTSKNLARNGGGTVIRQGGINIPLGKDNIAGVTLATGDQLCYMTIVSRYTQAIASSVFRYKVDCARMAARPKVQFWGADVRVGGSLSGGAGNAEAKVRTAITVVRR